MIDLSALVLNTAQDVSQVHAKSIQFDGACPFLMCLETGQHGHPICPECGAVRYGNFNCKTCRDNAKDETERRIDAELLDADNGLDD